MLEACEDVGNCVYAEMAEMKSTGRIREHGEDVSIGTAGQASGLGSRSICSSGCPSLAPFRVNCLEVETLWLGGSGAEEDGAGAQRGQQPLRPSQAGRKRIEALHRLSGGGATSAEHCGARAHRVGQVGRGRTRAVDKKRQAPGAFRPGR